MRKISNRAYRLISTADIITEKFLNFVILITQQLMCSCSVAGKKLSKTIPTKQKDSKLRMNFS